MAPSARPPPGLVANYGSAIVELNSETDFVAKNEQFIALAEKLAEQADETKPADAEAFAATPFEDGKTVAEAVADMAVAHRREDRARSRGQLRRRRSRPTCTVVPATCRRPSACSSSSRATTGHEVARSVAMQIAAMRPRYLTREDVPADVVAKEREIAEATAREEGKPEQAIAKIIEGRLNGFFKETVLLEQPSVQDNKKTVKARARRGRRDAQALRAHRDRRLTPAPTRQHPLIDERPEP